MSKARRLKKKLVRKLNVVNSTIAVFAVFAGYVVVAFLSGTSDLGAKQASNNDLTRSAIRLADSFEYYNQKKFDSSLLQK